MTFLYVIKTTNSVPTFYKIGVSINPSKRLKQLQTGSPYKLMLSGAIEHPKAVDIERKLHRLFSDKNTNLEWFALSSTDINFLNHLAKDLEEDNTEGLELLDYVLKDKGTLTRFKEDYEL